mgnify:CR=1 FL=1
MPAALPADFYARPAVEVARAPLGAARANRIYRACCVCARDGRVGQLNARPAVAYPDVEVIEGCRAHAHADFARPWLWDGVIRHEAEHFRRAVFGEQHCLHETPLRSQRAGAPATQRMVKSSEAVR